MDSPGFRRKSNLIDRPLLKAILKIDSLLHLVQTEQPLRISSDQKILNNSCIHFILKIALLKDVEIQHLFCGHPTVHIYSLYSAYTNMCLKTNK